MSCRYVQCASKKTECGDCGRRGCGEWGWVDRVHLRRAVHDMKDTDNACEGLCWVLHDYVVDGCLMYRCCVGPRLEHKFGKGLAEVGPSGDGSFESCGRCSTRRLHASVKTIQFSFDLLRSDFIQAFSI